MKLLRVRADRYGVYLIPAAVVAAVTITPRAIYPIVEAAALRGWAERENRRLPYRVDEFTTLTSFSFEQDDAVFHYDVRGSAVDPVTFLTTVRARAVLRADCRSLFGLAAIGVSAVRHVYRIGGAEHSLRIAADDCGQPAGRRAGATRVGGPCAAPGSTRGLDPPSAASHRFRPRPQVSPRAPDCFHFGA